MIFQCRHEMNKNFLKSLGLSILSIPMQGTPKYLEMFVALVEFRF